MTIPNLVFYPPANKFSSHEKQNGMGAFILPCKRLSLHYCDWAGSSRGMNAYLTSSLFPSLARQNPSIEIQVSPRPNRHPTLIAQYVNGRTKAICVRNLEPFNIHQKAQVLVQSSGAQNRKIRGKNVVSGNENVRGMWSPFHGGLGDV